MNIVNIQDIKKYNAAQLVLDGVTLQIQESEKAGLIGRNGCGKSTLLRLIAAHEQADEGMLTVKKEAMIGYLPQIPAEFEQMTVYEVLAYGYKELLAAQDEMRILEQRMSAQGTDNMDRLLNKYAAIQERFELGGGYEISYSIDQVASGLQIARDWYDRSFDTLSGGEKTRIVLASQLIGRPDLLLLDEPTNHLDLKGIEWLEQFLQSYQGACLIVSHDRHFLDVVCRTMIELEDGEAHTYYTNYTGYIKEKEERLLQQFAHYQEQQKVIKKMKETIRKLEEWGRIGDNEKFFKRAASMRRALERMEKVKRPVLEQKTAGFELSLQDRSGIRVAQFEGLYKKYGSSEILLGAEGSLLYGEKVVMLGDNGSCKTTLFKLLLGEETPDSGSVALGSRVEIGVLAQQEQILDERQTVLDYFSKEGMMEEGEARHLLARYLFYGADVFKRVGTLSGGEWSRLRLAVLVRKKPNLLLLDEPTNHLDIASREALEEALIDFPGTVLAISHDRYFINWLAQRVWELEQGKLTYYLGNYDDYREDKQRRQSVNPASVIADKQSGRNQGVTVGKKSEAAGESSVHKRASSSERKLQQLERSIASLEEAMLQLDEQLNRLNASGDSEQLEACWHAREKQQLELDHLLEQWMELSQ